MSDPDAIGTPPEPAEVSPRDAALRAVREALRGLQFGTVTLIVQDGRVIQVDRTEKRRLRRDRTD